MGLGRSSSLRIDGDSAIVPSSERTRGAPDRSATVELRDVPGALPPPLVERPEASLICPEPTTVEESSPILKEEERLGPMVKANGITKSNQLNPSVSSYQSKRNQRGRGVMVLGIRRKKLPQERRQKKTLHKRGRRRARRKRSTR